MDEATTRRWLERRLEMWQQTGSDVQRLEQGGSVSPEVALRTIRAYPEIARDLALARRVVPGGRATRRLEAIYAGLHRALMRDPVASRLHIVDFLARDLPAAVDSLKRHILWTSALFVACCVAGWWAVASYPELIGLFAAEEMIETVHAGELWTDGLLNVMPSSLLAVGIFTNNIVVAMTAMCLGVFYGLGTIYVISLNGLMLGGIFAFTARHDLAWRLFDFVCAHGFVELSAICIAGAVGVSVGEALARPGNSTRSAAFQSAVRSGGQVILACVVFLIGAGIIEGYVSPNPNFSTASRLAIGLGYWGCFVVVLSGRAIRLRRSAARTQIRR